MIRGKMSWSLRALTVALLSFPVVLTAAGTSADWPRWLGPNADGFTPDKGLNTNWTAKPPKELWRAKLTSEYSGISAADGVVVLIDHEGEKGVVRAFSLADGKEVWQFPFADDAKNQAGYGYHRATPAFADGKVYCFTRKAQLLCLNTKTGAKIWSSDETAGYTSRLAFYGHCASPVVDGDAVVVLSGGGDRYLTKLDKETGKLIAKGGDDEWPSAATPVVATIGGVKQYVVFSCTRLAGIDCASGEILWKHPWESASSLSIPTPIVIGDAIVVVGGYAHNGSLFDINGNSAKVRWENKNLVTEITTPLYKDGFVYANHVKKQLVCVEAKTGELKWKQDNFGWGGMVGLEDALIAVHGDTGEAVLVKLTPAAYTELGRLKPFAAEGKYWNPPIIADRRLLLRGPKELVCFDLR